MARSSEYCFECRTPMRALFPWTLFALGLLLTLSVCKVAAQEDLTSSTNEALLQSISDKWQLQREDLSLVEIAYRSVSRVVPDRHSIGRDQVRKLLHKLAKDNNSKSLAEVGAALDPSLKRIQPAWADGMVLIEGRSFLSEESAPGDADSLFAFVRHLGYELHIKSTATNRIQVDVKWEQDKIRSGPQGLNDFIAMPPSTFLRDARVTILQGNEKEERVLVSKPKMLAEFIMSSETGFVHECSRGKYGDGHYYEYLQFNPTQHGTTIVMPELYFKGRYLGNRLSSFSLRMIDKLVTSPKEISKSFQVAVLPGDVVIDHTGETREMVKFSQPTDDVIADLLNPNLARRPLKDSR